jgi:hypothetical protein
VTGQLRNPKQALNKAYLKLKPTREEIENFKKNLILLIEKIDIKKNEEHTKNLFRDFLLDTYYKDLYEINVKDRNDLVIHSEKTSASPVSVIIEAKRPSENYDFPKVNNLNVKAMHELVLYYLRERVDCANSDIRHLIATNGNEWFIFDGSDFYKYFYSNPALLKEYNKWNAGQKDSASTRLFYEEIAKKYIEEVKKEIPFTYFNINDYDKFLRNENKEDDKNLIPLFKLLSPSHLLKLSFSNDSNSLDKNFYFELLHIIGLEETKDGSKKIIQRKKAPDEGSLLENTINTMKSEDCLYNLTNPDSFGKTEDEKYFGVALELNISWINRILFLKLLESQLLKYFKGDKDYKFLNHRVIENFDDLQELFLEVLAKEPHIRSERINKKYSRIPYLNSSLFELTKLESQLCTVNKLKDSLTIPVSTKTVLTDSNGKKLSGSLNTLRYLFDFLDSYDFGSEGSEDIQEERKTLINSSVLGLIFEKINGYKDGSFFTPGFITMYMCRETIRRSVIQKFNDAFRLEIKDFSELKNFVGVPYKKEDINKYNDVINSLKICDPAVGSGHFLVSALNEIIAIKSELNILADIEGNRVTGYEAFVENDELMLVNSLSGDIFEYIPGNQTSQKIQETLFREKQTIIENCLFGVDINHNSVKICRLRLWIELLKNAYYTKASSYKELETLPNIDINIKCGNSLVSRFGLDADLTPALRKSKWKISTYRLAVQSYQNAKTKNEKRDLEKLLNDIKNNFRTEISENDPKQKRLNRLENELYEKYTSNKLLFVSLSDKEKAKEEKEKLKLIADIEKAKAEIKEIKESAIYRNAFEWRFEFPEVLDEKGNYIGFDVVIGNPPYIFGRDWKALGLPESLKTFYKNNYSLATYQIDLYILFLEKSFSISTRPSSVSLIVPNTWLNNTYANIVRSYLLGNTAELILSSTPANSFEGVGVDTVIVYYGLNNKINDNILVNSITQSEGSTLRQILKKEYYLNGNMPIPINLGSKKIEVISKINRTGINLGKLCEITRGIHPYRIGGYGKSAFSDGTQTEKDLNERPYHSPVAKNGLRPFVYGKDLKKFGIIEVKEYISYGEWLAEPRNPDFFQGERIYSRKILGESLVVTYVNDDSVADQQVYISKPKNNEITAGYLTALLGSKLIGFYIRNFYDEKNDLFPQIKVSQLKDIPIQQVSKEKQNELSKIVLTIIDKKKLNSLADITDYENKIDRLVYQLYGLTEEEIEIVERG